MPETIGGRMKAAWNAFMNRDPPIYDGYYGSSSSYRPDRSRLLRGNERSIVTSVYNRIAMDCASIGIMHVKLDENGRYIDTVDSGLNRCLTLYANKDQTARAFIQDAILSMFDEGCVAVIPIDTTTAPWKERSYDINSMRVGKILQWFPDHVQVRAYNDRTGFPEDIILPKSAVAIIENPLYAVMNEPNSTVKRLARKLSLLDQVDEQSGAGKLDLIIQLPYAVKTKAMQERAEGRRKDLEQQLKGSQYGVAYTDGSERIVQLNRPLENNLLKQVEYLEALFYSQLGITKEIMDGTATESTMQNYYSRSIEPVLSTFVESCRWKFLTEKNRSDRETIMFFRDPFKLVPVSAVPDIADKLTRNEIMTSNEVRQIIGLKPSTEPEADELRNKNLNPSKEVQNEISNKKDMEEQSEDTT